MDPNPDFSLEEMVEHLNKIKPGESKLIGSYDNALFYFREMILVLRERKNCCGVFNLSGRMSYLRCDGSKKNTTPNTVIVEAENLTAQFDLADDGLTWKVGSCKTYGDYAFAQITSYPVEAELRIYPFSDDKR